MTSVAVAAAFLFITGEDLMSTLELIFIVSVLFFGGLGIGISGGGIGLIIALACSFVLPLPQSLALAGIACCIAQTVPAIRMRRDIQWRIFFRYSLPGILGSALGARLAKDMPLRASAVILLVACLAFIFVDPKRIRFPKSTLALCVIGFLGGFLGGLTRAGFLIRVPIMMSMKLPPTEFVATSAAMGWIANISSSVVYIANFHDEPAFLDCLIPAAIVSPIAAILGLYVLYWVSERTFQRGMKALLLVGAVSLLIRSFL